MNKDSQTSNESCRHGLVKIPGYVCKQCVKSSLNKLHGAMEFALAGELRQ